jgi:hypothetical protein
MEVVYPTETQKKADLIKAILNKVTTDGIGGELVDFLIAQKINLATDLSNANDAVVNETDYGTNFRLGEKNNEIANTNIDKVELVIRGVGQVLKLQNAPSYKVLGTWGFEITANGKIFIPTVFNEKGKLFESINEKYLTYLTGTAPLMLT